MAEINVVILQKLEQIRREQQVALASIASEQASPQYPISETLVALVTEWKEDITAYVLDNFSELLDPLTDRLDKLVVNQDTLILGVVAKLTDLIAQQSTLLLEITNKLNTVTIQQVTSTEAQYNIMEYSLSALRDIRLGLSEALGVDLSDSYNNHSSE